MENRKTILLTGGGGFLGSLLIERLYLRCVHSPYNFTYNVRVLDLISKEDFQRKLTCEEDWCIREALKHGSDKGEYSFSLEWMQGDMLDDSTLAKAMDGVDAVIHTASLVDFGNLGHEILQKVNVDGTGKLMAQAEAAKSVKVFIYTSSLDTVFVDKGIDGLNEETARYVDPKTDFVDFYMQSKVRAEKLVVEHCKDFQETGMCCMALRPSGMFGPRDPVKMSNLLWAACQLGPLFSCRIGDSSAVCNDSFVGNVAELHVCALEKALSSYETRKRLHREIFVAKDHGKVMNFNDRANIFLAAKHYKIPTIQLSSALMYNVAHMCEIVKHGLNFLFPSTFGKRKLLLTRQAILGSSRHFWFYTDKAERLLDYKPVYAPLEAVERTIAYFEADPNLPKGNYVPKNDPLQVVRDDPGTFETSVPWPPGQGPKIETSVIPLLTRSIVILSGVVCLIKVLRN